MEHRRRDEGSIGAGFEHSSGLFHDASRGFVGAIVITIIVALVVLGSFLTFVVYNGNRTDRVIVQPSDNFGVQSIPLEGLIDLNTLGLSTNQSLSVNGQLRANNSLIITPSVQPIPGVTGQIYYDQLSNGLAYYDGTEFVGFANTNSIFNLQSQITNLQSGSEFQQTAVIPDDIATLSGENVFTDSNFFQNALTVNGVASLGSDLIVTGTATLGATSASSLVLSSPLAVSSGGTGTVSHVMNGVLIGQGSGALAAVTAGGTGLCLMSTAGAPTFQACPGGVGSGVDSLNGLTGALSIANASGSGLTITLDDASTVMKGIVSFNAANFSVSSGVASIAAGGVGGTELANSAVTTLKITDGNVTNAKLANSTLSVTAGSGLTNGGSVSLGGNVTLNIGAGSGITVNADDVAVDGTVCRTSGNCAGVGGTGDILQGGNSFGATMTLGTNDAQNFTLETNNVPRLTVDSAGDISVFNNFDVFGTLHASNDVNVDGTVSAAELLGDGSGLLNLNASELSSGTVASSRLTGSYTGITGVGTIGTGVWQGTAIADLYLQDNLTISSSGIVDWTALNNYPAACVAGSAVTALGDSPTCTAFAAASGSGNYIQNQNAGAQSSSNFWISGTGRADGGLTAPSLTSAAALALSATGANAITFSTNGSEVMRVSSAGSGSVGIGTSPSGSSKLQVFSTPFDSVVGETGMSVLTSPIITGSNGGNYIAGNFDLSTASTPTFTGTFKGVQSLVRNTGTGTIDTTYGFYSQLQNTSSGTINTAYGYYGAAPTNTGTIGNYYAAAFMGGNVGIGDSSPASLLTVGANDAFQVNNSGQVVAGTWQGSAIADTYVADGLTVSSSGSVDWTALNNYPAACAAGSAVTTIGDTLTCTAFAAASGSGSYIQNQFASAQSSANFWISGNARIGTNLTVDGNATFDTDTLVVDGATNRVGIGDASPAALLTVGASDAFQVNNSGTVVTTSTLQGTQLISTVTTGTAPLQVASTTLVTNLNADSLDGQTGSYYQDASNLNTGTLASARISGSYTGITGVGTIGTGTWQGAAVNDTYVADTLTVNSSSSVHWQALNNYPAACSAGQAITQLGDSVTCSSFAASSGSGNYIQNQTASPQSAGFNISGSGYIGGNFVTGGVAAIGGVQGSELRTGNCTGAVSGSGSGPYTVSGDGGISCPLSTAVVAGETYKITYSITDLGSLGFVDVTLATSSDGGSHYQNSAGTYTKYVTASSSGSTSLGFGVDWDFDVGSVDISNISVKMLGAGSGQKLQVYGDSTFHGNLVVGAAKTIRLVGGTTASRPGSPTEGMIYYDTDTDKLLVYSNGKWQADRSAVTKTVAPSNASQDIKDSADYVATGTADQTVINSALTAAASGKVYLFEGTFSTTDAISIPNNTTLAGAGNGTLIQFANIAGQTRYMITNTDTTTGTGVTVRDVKVDGNKAVNTTGAQIGVYFNGVGNYSADRRGAQVLNVLAQNFISNGLRVDNSQQSTIANSTANNNGGTGIFFISTSQSTITGNTANGNASVGIGLNTATNNSVTGNTTNGNTGNGITVTANSHQNSISGNTFNSNNSNGISVSSTSNQNTITGNTANGNTAAGIVLTSTANHNTVTGNVVSSSGTHGINLNAALFNTVSDNTIADSTNNGVQLVSSADDNIISGNNVYNSGGSGSNSAILINSGNRNQVVGNRITDIAGTGHAISINSSSVNDTYLADNYYSGTGATSINDSGTGTIYASQVNGSGNLLLQPTGTVELLKNTNVTGTLNVTSNFDTNGSLTVGSANQFVVSNTGTVTAGTWQGGTVGVAHGGTGATTFTANALLVGNGTGALSSIGTGTAGQCLISNGSGSAPTWGDCDKLVDPSHPDGLNATTVNTTVTNSATYTVPAGKTLHITGARFGGAGTLEGVWDRTAAGNVAFDSPLIFAAGHVVNNTSSLNNITFNGYLTDSGVTPITQNVTNSATYTVPAGKNLYVNAVFLSASGAVLEDVGGGNGGTAESISYSAPLVFTAGTVLNNTANTATITFNGYLTPADGSGGADLAESYFVTGGAEAGDIVAVDPGSTADAPAVTKTGGAYDSKLIAIISTKPGITLSDETTNGKEGTLSVALKGRVPLKMTNEGGCVAAGDPITSSSIPGMGMKAAGKGRIIGYALESWCGEDGSKMLVFISPDHYDPVDGDNIQGANMALTGNLQMTGDASIGGNLNVSGQTTLESLTVTGDVDVQGKLTVAGDTELQSIVVNGHIVTSGNVPTVVAGVAAGQSGQNEIAPSAIVDGNDSAGTINVTAGTQNTTTGVVASITFAEAFSGRYKVVLTAGNVHAGALRVHVVKTATGFDVVANDPLASTTEYIFDYIVIGIKK